jgi:hypothetical protein
VNDQIDLFGEDAQPAAKPAYVPKRAHILSPLNEALTTLRAAKVWPWDEVQSDLYRNHVWPHLFRHLPDDEAARWRADLEAEVARLGQG